MNERLDNGPAIEAKGLVKRYGDEVVAVDGVDLSIPAN
jgi:ABC-type multidrug transport system ATPase subunit